MLPIFPPGFEATLLVPVLIGLIVTALLTEWWGWDFVGVVVPGYLCSVLMLEPAVGLVVVIEAVLTWALARGLDGGLVRAGVTFPVFGRDRFFLILVVSVLVRVAVEGFALQPMAAAVERVFPAAGRWRAELFGIGLVLVPLAANRFWRPGLRSGLIQLTVVTGIVWVLVASLAAVTNFSMSGFALAYDNLALQFLTSPGAQLTLLGAAALASQLNRRYGWDYHGILVPALLALAVVTPGKLAATVVEALAILVVIKLLLRLPALRHANIEGPRKVVLCFVVGFALKFALAHTLAASYPGYRPTDFFGFGYLLPSLLAERIWTKSRAALVLVPTVQTSIVGAVAAALLALGLSRLVPTAAAGDTTPVEQYATLAQAIASRADKAATTDGYRLERTADGSVVARRAGSKTVLLAGPLEAEPAALEAPRREASLVVAPDPDHAARLAEGMGTVDRTAVPPVSAATGPGDQPYRRLLAGAIEGAASGVPPVERALIEAGARLGRHRTSEAVLARALAPLGLGLLRSTDGHLVAVGDTWPVVALAREAPRMVVAAPHPREAHSAAAALWVASVLPADVVLGEGAVSLAMALGERHRRPLLIVRGAARIAEGDALLITQPAVAGGRPAWLEDVVGALEGRMQLRTTSRADDAQLHAFPVAAGRLVPVGLLWLSSPARRMLVGADEAIPGRRDFIDLAARRGVPLLAFDAAAWLAEGAGAPPTPVVAAIERMARTEDIATVRPIAGADLRLLVDEPRGVVGFAVTVKHTRALSLVGPRQEAISEVRGAADAARAIAGGSRTLVTGAAPPQAR